MDDLKPKGLGGLSPSRFPEAYVRAEIASYPLVGMASFRTAIIGLSSVLIANDSTRDVWRECEQELCKYANGWSLDRLIAVRDYFWFEKSCPEIPPQFIEFEKKKNPLHRYLRNLARKHFEPHSGTTWITQRVDENTFDAVTRYRWLTFALPEDLLLAARGIDPPPARVDFDPSLLTRNIDDRGVAEIHQHVNAGMNFPYLWDALLAALASRNFEKEIPGPGLPFDDGKIFIRWLLAAAIARCLLAGFLISPAPGVKTLSHQIFALRAKKYFWTPQRYLTLTRVLCALVSGNDYGLPEFEEMRSLYQSLHYQAYLRSLDHLPSSKLDKVVRLCDPVGARIRVGSSCCFPGDGEKWLVQRSLEHLEKNHQQDGDGHLDNFFETLFWQVIRLRCQLYRTVVQRPMTSGLQWFVRFYDRAVIFKDPLDGVRAELAFRVGGGERKIAAFEARCGIDSSSFGIAAELLKLLKSWKEVLLKVGKVAGGREPEFGVLMHFIKTRDFRGLWKNGRPSAYGQHSHAEPSPCLRFDDSCFCLGGRYSNFFEDQANKANALVELIEAVPSVLWLIRGLDVTSDELAVPNWVLVPLFQYVERRAARVAGTYSSEDNKLPLLRMTAHVGEDFRHLMEGLRRIFESIHYLLKPIGCRLGHATALGLEPRFWAESAGSIMMPKEDRLWDLVFEWRAYSRYRVFDDFATDAPPGRPEKVENEICELSYYLFGQRYDPIVLAEAHHVLHELWNPSISVHSNYLTSNLNLDGFIHSLEGLDPEEVHYYKHVLRVLQRYRERESMFQRGQQLVDVALDESELAALYTIQNALRRCISNRGIVVEVNPTSNLLIGSLLDLRNHPILRLFPPEPRPDSPPPVSIALGADDPVVFSTYLVREYSLLHEAGLRAGYSESSVTNWLERIQLTSMDARFTETWRPNAKAMALKLLRDLRRYLHQPAKKKWRGE